MITQPLAELLAWLCGGGLVAFVVLVFALAVTARWFGPKE